jgi:hypothetical protein
MNNKHLSGVQAELFVALELSKLEYTILWPYGTQCRYDLAIEKGGIFSRVQVKKATSTKTGKYEYLQARISSRNKNSKPLYTKGEFEYFAFTNMKDIWLVPFDNLDGNTSVCLGSTNPNYKRQTKYDVSTFKL